MSDLDGIPVHEIDLAPFIAGTGDGRRSVVEAFDRAGRDSGFLILTGHGVPPALVAEALDAWQEFFDLPEADKLRCLPETHEENTGYTPFATQALAYTTGDETPPDLLEAYSIGREDAVGPAFDAYREWFQPNIWPDRPQRIKAVTMALESALREVAEVVLRAMALALDLPERWLVERNEHGVITLRPNHYRQQPDGAEVLTGQQRLGAHTDYGVMTLLVADPVPGLQILRNDRWWDVTPPEGAIVCNIGDMLAMWTNDEWVSTMHRVEAPRPGVGNPSRRRSLARFLDGDPSVVIEPIPSCVDPAVGPRYQPVQAGAWLMAKVVGGAAAETVALPDGGLTSTSSR